MNESRDLASSQMCANSLNTGDKVFLEIGETSADCMVFHSRGGGVILTPLQVTPPFQSVLTNLPVKGSIQRADGTQHSFLVSSSGAVQAIAGEILAERIHSRRRYFRIRLGYGAKVSLDGTSWYSMQGQDVSIGGALLHCDGRIRVSIGQALFVCLYLPGCKPITATAAVKRISSDANTGASGPYKVGLEFVTVSAESSKELAQYIYQYQGRHAQTRAI